MAAIESALRSRPRKEADQKEQENKRLKQCNVPLKSSHIEILLFSVYLRTWMAHRLVRTGLVVPSDPLLSLVFGFSKGAKWFYPDILLFQRAKESLYDTVLLWLVRRDERLFHAVTAAGKERAVRVSGSFVWTCSGGRSVVNLSLFR